MPHRSCTGFVLFCYVRRCITAGTYTWPGRAIRRQFRISVQQNSIGSVLHNLGLGNYHRTVSSVGLAVYHLSGYPLEVMKRSNAYKSTFINIWLYKSLLPPTLQCLATITKKKYAPIAVGGNCFVCWRTHNERISVCTFSLSKLNHHICGRVTYSLLTEQSQSLHPSPLWFRLQLKAEPRAIPSVRSYPVLGLHFIPANTDIGG